MATTQIFCPIDYGEKKKNLDNPKTSLHMVSGNYYNLILNIIIMITITLNTKNLVN